jgi:hypothetical protein
VSVSQGFLCTTEPSIRDAEGTNEFDYGPNSSSVGFVNRLSSCTDYR